MLDLTGFPSDRAGAAGQAVQIRDGAVRSVRIVECRQEGRALAELVRQLNFLPEMVEGSSFDASATLASIISDRSPAPFEACAALKRHGPIIMISSDTSFTFRLAAARAGVEAIVKRPLDPLELAGWLEHFANRAAAGSISVLIIDDDPVIAELCGEVLQDAGMTVATLTDPALAPSVIEATLPDLVVMDMWMPQVDGVELARIIRQSRRFIALPIIFLSGEMNPERQLAARMLGGDDFIVKPVDPQKLVALLRLRAERARVLRTMIERDSLTGLYDHGRFKERLSHELERCRKFGGELCLIMIDIDHFKSVNDRFGHLLGDGVIRALSGLLCGGLRKSDIVGRYGGEEFGVIMLDTEPRSALRVIDKLRRMFEQVRFDAEGRSFSVTFSAGIACSRHYGALTDLIAATDVALYRAKHAGRNIVEFMQPEAPRH